MGAVESVEKRASRGLYSARTVKFFNPNSDKARSFIVDNVKGGEYLMELADLTESIPSHHPIFMKILEGVRFEETMNQTELDADMLFDALSNTLFRSLIATTEVLGDASQSSVVTGGCNWLPLIDFHRSIMKQCRNVTDLHIPLNGLLVLTLIVEWFVEYWLSQFHRKHDSTPYIQFISFMEMTHLIRDVIPAKPSLWYRKVSWKSGVVLPQLNCHMSDDWIEVWRNNTLPQNQVHIVAKDLSFKIFDTFDPSTNASFDVDRHRLYTRQEIEAMPTGKSSQIYALIVNEHAVSPIMNEFKHRVQSPIDSVFLWLLESMQLIPRIDAYVSPVVQADSSYCHATAFAWFNRSMLTSSLRIISIWGSPAQNPDAISQSFAGIYNNAFGDSSAGPLNADASEKYPMLTAFLEFLPMYLVARDAQRPMSTSMVPLDELTMYLKKVVNIPATVRKVLEYEGVSPHALVDLFIVLRGLVIMSSRKRPREADAWDVYLKTSATRAHPGLPILTPQDCWDQLMGTKLFSSQFHDRSLPSIQDHLSDVPIGPMTIFPQINYEALEILSDSNAFLAQHLFTLLTCHRPIKRSIEGAKATGLAALPSADDPQWRHALFVTSSINVFKKNTDFYNQKSSFLFWQSNSQLPDEEAEYQSINIFPAAAIFLAGSCTLGELNDDDTLSSFQPSHNETLAIHKLVNDGVTFSSAPTIAYEDIDDLTLNLIQDPSRLGMWCYYAYSCPIWRDQWISVMSANPSFTVNIGFILLESFNKLYEVIHSNPPDENIEHEEPDEPAEIDEKWMLRILFKAQSCLLLLIAIVSDQGMADILEKQRCPNISFLRITGMAFRRDTRDLSILAMMSVSILDRMNRIVGNSFNQHPNVRGRSVIDRMICISKTAETFVHIASNIGVIDDILVAEKFVLGLQRSVDSFLKAYDIVYDETIEQTLHSRSLLLLTFSSMSSHLNYLKRVQMEDALSKGNVIFAILRVQRGPLKKLSQFIKSAKGQAVRPITIELYISTVLATLNPIYDELEDKLQLSDSASPNGEFGVNYVRATIKDTVGSIQYRKTRSITRKRSSSALCELATPTQGQTDVVSTEPKELIYHFLDRPSEDDKVARISFQAILEAFNQSLVSFSAETTL
eukprot:GHVH01005047.1.p1 GENE.GHVH01005047.1~~GHVH01005047.1.p1  ORF type:complete len:1128 (+),score=166.42 GHVH01005047.1:3657-7040(+)